MINNAGILFVNSVGNKVIELGLRFAVPKKIHKVCRAEI